MDIWIASFNGGKIRELSALIQRDRPHWVIHHPQEIPGYSAPQETGNTFEENARIKVRSLAAVKPGHWILGEDSGLVVPGLNGLPGIHSAVYAGPHATDLENVNKLLKMLHLKGVTDRSAFFVCVMVSVDPQGRWLVARGELQGQIAMQPQGKQGFGYDPIFIPKGQTQTLAELGPIFKSQHSHRALAFREWLSQVDTLPVSH
ncbi:MAG: RdgB/HAM1 family non-canonical purine NTP pyrophosphatase [Bdellovibrionaceae bacterium]|nr:RdgB/HAM1 family non-canonical purine NTP pyrophosphatase [Pseudobdellovibrionaceae bacterium]MDW8190746.1 RdgB/HAM1 family non-canonical purine NTP pyrophosphatase [Pseudobdellovibrionaceae bacterium]